jgi:phytoene synthase
MQLTNILRDVGGDLTRDRVYLPEDELRSFGLARRDLELLATKRRGPDERFRALMKYQIARAHCYYSHGMAGVWYLPRESRFPILVAGRLYRRILTVIERNDYDVLRARASTNLREKLQEAGMALLLERLWRHGEQPRGDASTVAALAVWEAGDAAEG